MPFPIDIISVTLLTFGAFSLAIFAVMFLCIFLSNGRRYVRVPAILAIIALGIWKPFLIVNGLTALFVIFYVLLNADGMFDD